jgi:hypothetical protein
MFDWDVYPFFEWRILACQVGVYRIQKMFTKLLNIKGARVVSQPFDNKEGK